MKKIKNLIGNITARYLFTKAKLTLWLMNKLEPNFITGNIRIDVEEEYDDGTALATWSIDFITIGELKYTFYPMMDMHYTCDEEQALNALLAFHLGEV